MPDSPQIEQGEHYTFVHRFKCDRINGNAILIGVPRGTVLGDSFGFKYKVLTSQYDQQKGDYGIVTITSECINVPPEDEFHVETVEFNPSLFLHPRYQPVLNYSAMDVTNKNLITGQSIIGWIKNAAQMSTVQGQTGFANMLSGSNITDPDVLELAQELFQKMQLGEDTFYLSGWRVYWSQYSTFCGSTPVAAGALPNGLNPGGYLEDPTVEGGLPYYFWSLDGTPGGKNTFSVTADKVNPDYYGNGLSWLRQADTIEYQRVWFKVTHSWIGGPLGVWDDDLYFDPDAMT